MIDVASNSSAILKTRLGNCCGWPSRSSTLIGRSTLSLFLDLVVQVELVGGNTTNTSLWRGVSVRVISRSLLWANPLSANFVKSARMKFFLVSNVRPSNKLTSMIV